ncbi:hypothetical protein KM043_009937 [Ampulex compressa]|nr:hypothetical protein KM043_009937 [Ampulex compressa]
MKSCLNDSLVVLVNKLGPVNKSKVPVYKSAKVNEESVKITSEIYDFKYDINDTIEKLAKRKKKGNGRKTVTKGIKKRMTKQKPKGKVEVDTASAASEPVKNLKDDAPNNADTNKPASPIQSVSCSNSPQHMVQLDIDTSVRQSLPAPVNSDITTSLLSDQTPSKQNKNTANTKPTILSVENLSKKKVTVISDSTEFRPFRPTNIFNKPVVQHKNLHNISLLNKSLSPILKANQNFDPGSPWRPPPLCTFSQVKNIFQSTPQPNRFDISQGKIPRVTKNDSNLHENILKENDIENNNQNENTPKHADLGKQKKKSAVARKFGTEITNIDHSMESDNPVVDVNEKVVVEPESTVNVSLAPETATPNAQNSSMFDDIEDKENTVPNYQTPKKTLKYKKKKTNSHSPRKSSITVWSDQKENIGSKPGPSGIRILGSPDKVLRQSNLNNFLNLTEMPESTKIVTRHGIFDDACPSFSKSSTVTVQNKALKEHTEIQNAFGFSDDDSNENIPGDDKPPTTKIKEQKMVEKKFDSNTFVPARLSIRAIRNNLLAKRIEPSVKSKPTMEKENREELKACNAKKDQVLIDVSNFSDTFDILSEAGEAPTMDVSEIPLFADLEPTHFTQPPRYSYKRNRTVTFRSSEESSDDDEEVRQYKTKRQKRGKLNKQDTKRLREWVQSVNQTFEEIDQYDLVIE